MALLDYTSRQIEEVKVWMFDPGVMEGADDGPAEDAMSAKVTFYLTSMKGGPGGPTVSIDLSLPVSHSTPFAEIERLFLEAAHAVLGRLAAEPIEAVLQGPTKHRDDLRMNGP